jgi:2-polyprenyl-6-methoxyphenol hydroxylase-like FAD-dependent oxidoreductase
MKSKTVLISGIGVAGPTLAYWLAHHGFEPTLLESASSLRDSGCLIDFWGGGLDVAEWMDLLPSLKEEDYDIRELRLVNEYGHRIGGFRVNPSQFVPGARFLSILRGDLARLLFTTVAGTVDMIFGNGVKRIEQLENNVAVTFAHGAPRKFDLVIGTDGLHSAVRSAVFGSPSKFERRLGYFAASFNSDGYPYRDEGAYVSYCLPGRQVTRYSLRENRTGFLLLFRDNRLPEGGVGTSDPKTVLAEVFHDAGWEGDAILAELGRSTDLYFDVVSQIRMPTWSRGRVAILGDAAFSPSLLAGQGSSLAMTAAYVLAGELKRANGDHTVAFKAYEATLKPLIIRKQRAAARLGRWFVPKSNLGIAVRNQASRLISVPPLPKWMVGRMLNDRISLTDYRQ